MNQIKESITNLNNVIYPFLKSDGCLPECDEEINQASADIVLAFQEQYSECFLINVNLYGDAVKVIAISKKIKSLGGTELIWT